MLHVLALVADTVAVIRLGHSDLSDVGSRLSDKLLADAGNGNFGKGRTFEFDAFGGKDLYGMGEADVEHQLAALHLPGSLRSRP